jgi:acyl-CoA reductase-like NAD-dependent aldehyde dehydrogenase
MNILSRDSASSPCIGVPDADLDQVAAGRCGAAFGSARAEF